MSFASRRERRLARGRKKRFCNFIRAGPPKKTLTKSFQPFNEFIIVESFGKKELFTMNAEEGSDH
jgi:hypothetical protein